MPASSNERRTSKVSKTSPSTHTSSRRRTPNEKGSSASKQHRLSRAWREAIVTARMTPVPTTSATALAPTLPHPANNQIASLTRTTYNHTALQRIALLGGGVLTIGLIWWLAIHQPWQALRPASLPPPPVRHYTVHPETLNQAALAHLNLPQASTPASATMASNLRPLYTAAWEQQSTPQLQQALQEQVTLLQHQNIDTKAMSVFVARGQAAIATHQDEQARTNFINGLELAKELQAVHDYYAAK